MKRRSFALQLGAFFGGSLLVACGLDWSTKGRTGPDEGGMPGEAGAIDCGAGFELDGDVCRKTDPCRSNNGGCAELCVSSKDAFQCACRPGFKLAADAQTCAALSWSAPTRVDRLLESAQKPQVVALGEGAIAVWEQSANLWSAALDGASAWDEPVQLTSVMEPMTLVPASVFIKSDAKGNVIVTWSATKPTPMGSPEYYESWFRRRTPSGEWRAAARVYDRNGAIVDASMNSQGTMVAALSVVNGTTAAVPELWLARYAPTTGWDLAKLLASPPSAYGARVAVREDGSAVLVGTGGGQLVYARVSSTDGTSWGAPAEVPNPKVPDSIAQLKLVLETNGAPVVAWLQHSFGVPTGSLRASQWSAATGWTVALELVGDVGGYDLAAGAGATPVVVWQDPTKNEPVRSRHLLTDGTWTPAEMISSANTASTSYPKYRPEQLVVNSEGISIAVWHERTNFDDTNSDLLIWSNILFPDGWNQRATVTPQGGAPIFMSELALAATRRGATVVWRQDNDIWASRLQ